MKKLRIAVAAIRPISVRLSRMESLLIEIRAGQDVLLKKAGALLARIAVGDSTT